MVLLIFIFFWFQYCILFQSVCCITQSPPTTPQAVSSHPWSQFRPVLRGGRLSGSLGLIEPSPAARRSTCVEGGQRTVCIRTPEASQIVMAVLQCHADREERDKDLFTILSHFLSENLRLNFIILKLLF